MTGGKALILLFLVLAASAITGYSQEAVEVEAEEIEAVEIEPTETEETETEVLADPTLGASVYRSKCTDCHGTDGDGMGPSAAFLKPLPADFTDTAWLHGKEAEKIEETIRNGVKGTAMAGFDNVLTDYEIKSLGVYLFQLSEPEK